MDRRGQQQQSFTANIISKRCILQKLLIFSKWKEREKKKKNLERGFCIRYFKGLLWKNLGLEIVSIEGLVREAASP